MINIKTFIFNPFQENTYVISDQSGECVIIDPGCSSVREQQVIQSWMEENNLTPVAVWCTHLHVDHVLGNAFFYETYGLKPVAHYNDQDLYNLVRQQAQMFGLVMESDPPSVGMFVNEDDSLTLGNSSFNVLHVAGHSPGGICFYNAEQKVVFVGDALFSGSIGRTDLWGGDHKQLIDNIRTKLLTLSSDTVVYPGHGPHTTIGEEISGNPFLQD